MKLIIDAKNDYLDNYIDYRDFKPKYKDTTELIITNYKETKYDFLSDNNSLIKISLPDTKVIGNGFLDNNKVISLIDLPKVEVINDHVLSYCENLDEINLPNAKFIGDSFLMFNKKVISVSLPKVTNIGDNFMSTNDKLIDFTAPKLKIVGDKFLEHADLSEITLPLLRETGENFLHWNQSIKKIYLPMLTSIEDGFLSLNRAYGYYFINEDSPSEIIDENAMDNIANLSKDLFNLYLDIEKAQKLMDGIKKDFNSAFSNKHLFEYFVGDCQDFYNLLSNLFFKETSISHKITDAIQSYTENFEDDTKISYLIFDKIYEINILDTPEDWTTILQKTNDLYRLIDATRNPEASYLFDEAYRYLQNYLHKILQRFSAKYVYLLQLVSILSGHMYNENKLNRTKEEIIKCIWMSKYIYDELFVLISHKLEKVNMENVSISELISIEISIHEKLRNFDKKEFLGGEEVLTHKFVNNVVIEDDKDLDYSSFFNAEYSFIIEDGRISKFESEIGLDLNIPPLIENTQVKEIGWRAFEKQHLNSVTLPKGLEIIAKGAFYDNNLTSIVIPDSVQEIEDNAFNNNKLKKITILGDVNRFNMRWKDIGFPTELVPGYYKQDRVIYAGDGTVIDYKNDYSSSDKSVDIPEKANNIEIQRVGNNAFFYDDLSSVKLPKTLKFIGNSAFSKNKLVEIVLPDNIEHIGWAAFSDNQLTKVVLPSKLEMIDGHVFSSNKLKEISIPSSVTKIRRHAFFENLLTSINIPDTVTTLEEGVFKKNRITVFRLPHSIKEIPDSLFEENALTIVEIKDGINKIGKSAFQNNSIKELILPDSIELIGEKAFDSNDIDEIKLPSEVKDISSAFSNNQIQKIVLPDGIENISGAFQNNNLSHVSLPDNLQSIGSYSFADNNISEINLPKQLVSIESSAFKNNQIDKVDLPDKLEKIGYSVFEGNNIENITIPESVSEISYSAFKENPIKKVIIKGAETRFNENWSNIGFPDNQMPGYESVDNFIIDGDGMIIKCTLPKKEHSYSGQEITIPEKIKGMVVSKIGKYAFSELGLNKIILPESIKHIGDCAFQENRGFPDLKLPGGLLTIGYQGFYACGIRNIKFPNSIEKIESGAFCINSIKSLEIPKTISEIESSTFSYNSIKKLNIPKNIESIARQAFYKNKIVTLILPEGLKKIGEEAFRENRIEELVIPSTVEEIGYNAFEENRITSVTIKGDESRFDASWEYIGFPSKKSLLANSMEYDIGDPCPLCGNELEDSEYRKSYCDECNATTRESGKKCPICETNLNIEGYCRKCEDITELSGVECPKCKEPLNVEGWCNKCEEYTNEDIKKCPICGEQLGYGNWCSECLMEIDEDSAIKFKPRYCSQCGNLLDEEGWCENCEEFFNDETNNTGSKTCPDCGNELEEDGWCDNCYEFFDE